MQDNSSVEFSVALAKSLLESDEQFPVDFDDAWVWLGYSKKSHAKVSFTRCEFIEDVDFRVTQTRHTKPDGSFSHYYETIEMTVDAFKTWGMVAGTEKGKQVRLYFLNCERELKRLQDELKSGAVDLKQLVQQYARIYKPEYLSVFWDELYRVTGFKRVKKGFNPAFARIINKYVYKMFPDGVLEELQQRNPVKYHYRDESSSYTATARQFKHHQFLADIVGLPTLQNHIQVMMVIMRLLPDNNPQAFYEAMDKAFPNGAELNIQRLILDLPDNTLPGLKPAKRKRITG